MELKDYYFILGVPRTATARDILHAYRALAKLYHPDRVGPQGTATFQDIVEAYAVLSDPERRRHYTESLSQFVHVTASAPSVPPIAEGFFAGITCPHFNYCPTKKQRRPGGGG